MSQNNTLENNEILQFANTNWATWKRSLDKLYNKSLRNIRQPTIIPNNRNLSNEEIEQGIVDITQLLQQNVKLNRPKIRRKNNMECFTNKIIERLYKHKSNIITRIKSMKRKGTHTIPQINALKTEIKRTNELITQNIKLQINVFWKTKLEAIKPGFKMFKKLKPFREKQILQEIHELEIDENEAKNMTDLNIEWNKLPKAGTNHKSLNTIDNLNIIGYYIEKQTTPNLQVGKTVHASVISQKVETIRQQHADKIANNITKNIFNDTNKANEQQETTDVSYFITIAELKCILACSNNKKSYGPDKIPSIILKHLPDTIISEMCTLFNNLLNNRIFPKCWKQAKIFPIIKKNKNPVNPSNYRPISLLSNLGKIYEIIIYNKIYKHTMIHNLIPDNQFGFRNNHTTTHAIAKLTTNICENLNKKICTGAVFLDMEKAFESVWLDGLIFKLCKMKFDTDIIYILLDMLYNRTFSTTIGTTSSRKIFNIYNGLQQGSITAPILFNLYTSDLVRNEKINTDTIQTIAYADDLVIYSADLKITKIVENLQNAINFTTNFLHTWRIKINERKCESILFRRPVQLANYDTIKNRKEFRVRINQENIELSTSVKYLGIHMDQFCYFNQHINKQIAKAKNAFFRHKKIFYSKYINPEVKRISYQSIIRPIITYGCPIWFNCNDSYMERIRLFERKCIRCCTGRYRKSETNYLHYISNKEQYKNFNTNRIDIHILQLIRNHIHRTTTYNENSLCYGPYHTDFRIIEHSIRKGNIPGPEAFIYLDRNGYIQDDSQLPLIYHVHRKPNEKHFDSTSFRNYDTNTSRFSTDFNRMEDNKYLAQKRKYWWLHGE